MLAYEDALREEGISLRLAPFLTSKGFAGFYRTDALSKARKVLSSALAYLRRRGEIASAGDADAVLVHREIVPRGNGRAVRRLKDGDVRFAYDLESGVPLNVVRIRLVGTLDKGFMSGSGDFFVTLWGCPSELECPDPSLVEPTVPEFAPPGNTFTMTRQRLHGPW